MQKTFGTIVGMQVLEPNVRRTGTSLTQPTQLTRKDTIMKRVRIFPDSDPCNPRTEWDCHSGRMLCWHDKYNLGDEHPYDSEDCLRELAFEACPGLEDMVNRLENDTYTSLYDRAIDHDHDDPFELPDRLIGARVDKLVGYVLSREYVILPLYLYDHSGITMSTGQFACQWDSGQVGWIVCDRKTIDADFGGNMELAGEALEAEVKTFDQYLTGDVYGFVVEERDEEDDEWEVTDSCHGFYGSDVHTNGMADHLDAELVEDAIFED